MSTETISMSTFEGFYMKDGPSHRTGRIMLFHGKKMVRFPDGNTLLREEHETYNYPISGWTWFDSLSDCCNSFGLDIEDYEEEIYGPYYTLITGKVVGEDNIV
jgi:hypothetical protein